MAKRDDVERAWRRLTSHADGKFESFDPDSLVDLPAPARRWLGRALPAGAPLHSAVVLEMHGEIRLGRWMPFTARQVLRAGEGFVWQPVVGGRLLRFVGADLLVGDDAQMDFRWQGILPVARASGVDTRRSAIGRLAAETVAWLPQAATPQAGARWTAIDDDRATVSLCAAGDWTDVEVVVDDDGRLRSVGLQRWNSGAKPPGIQPFGGDITSEHVTEDGVRIAGTASIGWDFGTPGWATGEFFRFAITSARPIT